MRSRSLGAAVTAAVLVLGLTGCGGNGGTKSAADDPQGDSTSAAPESSKAKITASIAAGASGVKVNRSVRLDVTDGTFSNVSVRTGNGAIKGVLSEDKISWQSTGRLQPGLTYRVRGVAVDEAGVQQVYTSRFRTQPLSLQQQTYPSFFPMSGSTVGVGMPVIVRFDVPVKDHASIQSHLKVTTTPVQAGAFHWISDNEVHWRPQRYWRPGTKVHVDADIDSVPAGNGVFGQKSRASDFTVGRSMISKVDMNSHQMRVFENGKLIRTIPITTGQQPKFTTRSGIKVIVEKFRHRRMNSETVGIPVDSADGYDLDDVEYAMRLTYSGEFVHAAPWSVASQGHDNVSHGCTGMSTENAGWLYGQTLIGDVVEYTGTSREMTLTNGIGDWNTRFADYAN
jgi:lipoprotein-anchoring transpeptidase ErfK/SrfK